MEIFHINNYQQKPYITYGFQHRNSLQVLLNTLNFYFEKGTGYPSSSVGTSTFCGTTQRYAQSVCET